MSTTAIKALRTGIVGFGRVAEGHLKQMREQEGCFDVVAVCDFTESRRAAAEEQGVGFTTDKLEEFLDQDLELVLIATHSSAHYEIAMPCLARGLHLVIEKPVTIHAKEAEEIFATAKQKGLTALVHHNRHFDPDVAAMREALREIDTGELVLVENRTGGPAPAVGFGVKDFHQQWRITKAMGGGTLMDFGPHWTEQILSVVPGKVTGVLADVRNVKWGDADDFFHITMLFDTGTRAVASKADFVYHTNPKWLVYGSKATLWSGENSVVNWKTGKEEGEQGQIAPPEQKQGLHRNYYEVIREGAAPLVSSETALRVAQVLDAAMQSADQRTLIATDI